MGYTVDSLVIETRTIRCGKCYKLNMDGGFSWERFSDEETVGVCDRYTGNCQIAPKRGTEDSIIDLVKEVWDRTTVIVQLLTQRMENVIEVLGYLWKQTSCYII